MDHRTLRTLQALATQHRRIVSREDLVGAGVPAGKVDALVRGPLLTTVFRGVYVVGDPELNQRELCAAAAALVDVSGALSHRTSAELRGWLRPQLGVVHATTSQHHLAGGHSTEVAMAGAEVPGSPGLVVIHATSKPRTKALLTRDPTARRDRERDADVESETGSEQRAESEADAERPVESEVVDGLPVTRGPRTLVDVAALHGPVVAGWAWDEAEFQAALDATAIEAELASRRAPGNRIIRNLLRTSFPATQPGEVLRSKKEQAIARLLAATNLPRPLFNPRMVLEGRPYRPDFLFVGVLAVEVDGSQHDLPRRNARDKQRDADFLVNGLPVLRFSTDAIDRQLATCANRLTRAYDVWSARRVA